MAHDVFISYSSKDKLTADAVCATLESRGIRCWIAPRDVLGGERYAEALLRALRTSHLMVLVFSSTANQSQQVLSEVERAVSRGLPIIPLRIEDVPPSDEMEYYISSRHWLDALTPPIEQHLLRLAETVSFLLSRGADAVVPQPPGQVLKPIPPNPAAAHGAHESLPSQSTPSIPSPIAAHVSVTDTPGAEWQGPGTAIQPPVPAPTKTSVVEPVPTENPEVLSEVVTQSKTPTASKHDSKPEQNLPERSQIPPVVAAAGQTQSTHGKPARADANIVASAPLAPMPLLTMASEGVAAEAQKPVARRVWFRAILGGVALMIVALTVIYFLIRPGAGPGSQDSNAPMDQAGKALSSPPPQQPPPPPTNPPALEDRAQSGSPEEKKASPPLVQEEHPPAERTSGVTSGPPDAKSASNAGELKDWRYKDLASVQAAASAGDAAAQFDTGERYFRGQRGANKDLAQAFIWYRKAAEQGIANAQANLAYIYQSGQGAPQDLALALFWYRKAADQGFAYAQFNLGRMYAQGQGVVLQNYGQAFGLYRKAADQGLADAQFNLGILYQNGQGVPQDYAQSIAWYRKSADQGYAHAQTNLGFMYAQGLGVQQDFAQAASWYRKAADQGSADAQTKLGLLYYRGDGVPKDKGQAASWHQKAADQGFAAAQNYLGVLYSTGEGVPKDKGQAASWFQKAADQGFAAAQSNLGILYQSGEGVPQDHAQAFIWFRKSADQGYMAGEYMLGTLYYRGEGVTQDFAQAFNWFHKAADLGHSNAQTFLANMYYKGEGVPRDYLEAAVWYRKAADQGNAIAQLSLGIVYQNGQGVTQDLAQARAWYQKAADQGNADAKNRLAALDGKH
jgi:TPR repeat protein